MPSEPVDAERIRQIAIELLASSQNGLAFARNEFDVRRFGAIRDLANELLSMLSAEPIEIFTAIFDTDAGYATPKVEVRGAMFDGDRVFLVQERLDGRWTLPGGWADPGDTPSGAVLREIREEGGIAAEVVKLAACWDREIHNPHPPMPVHVYKLFFLCRALAVIGEPDPVETEATGWFEVDDLPELSLGRVTPSQIARMYAHAEDLGLSVDFD